MTRRALVIALACVPLLAAAQAYPSRAIKFVVPFPPGGGVDIVARAVGEKLGPRLGQPVVIENRPGAGTNLAAQAVVTASPDGYTLLFTASTYAINATLYETLPYNFLRDIVPVAGLAELPPPGPK